MQVQALVPETAVERLDIRIVRRPAGSTEHQGYFMLIRSQVRQPPGKFTSLDTVDAFRCTPVTSYGLQSLHDLGPAPIPESGCGLPGTRVYTRRSP